MAGRASARTTLIIAALALIALGLSGGRRNLRPISVAAPAVAVPGQPSRRDAASPLTIGSVLVASRTMGDPNFAETVVLLFAYSPDGAAGLVINRQTQVPLQRVLPDLPIPKGPEAVVFLGGPVLLSGVRGLVRSPTDLGGLPHVLDDVYLLTTPESLHDALAAGAGPEHIRLYAGYAGWGAGQLEREVRVGAWHIFNGQSGLVFDPNPDTVWARQIRLTEMLAV